MGIIPSHARGKALTDSLAACTRHPIGTASKIPPWSEKATTEKEARSIPARLDCQTSCRCAEEKKKTYVTATFKGLPGKADVPYHILSPRSVRIRRTCSRTSFTSCPLRESARYSQTLTAALTSSVALAMLRCTCAAVKGPIPWNPTAEA